MGTRGVSYPVEVKEEAVRLRMAGDPVAEVMDRLGIKASDESFIISLKYSSNNSSICPQ